MNNILCPLSAEKINEKIVRFTAFLAFLIALVFIYNPNIFLVAFLVFDFYSRGFGISHISILALTGFGLKDYIPFRSRIMAKAPKIFAARTGLMLSLLVLVLLLFDLVLTSQITMIVFAFFAFLEWAAGFSMGCYVYNWIVLPYFNKR